MNPNKSAYHHVGFARIPDDDKPVSQDLGHKVHLPSEYTRRPTICFTL
jgi:hypothetical protein